MKRIILLLLLIPMVIILTGCDKKALTTDEFIRIMNEKEYKIEDITKKYEDEPKLKKVIIASNNNYQIEFYEVDSVENTKSLFNINKQTIENKSNIKKSTLSTNYGNYSYYAQTSDNKYSVITRISNTLIYLNVDEKYKKETKELIKELGY